MKFISICLFVFLAVAAVMPQSINIRVNNLEGKNAQIAFLRGEKAIMIDSMALNEKAEFHYTFAKNAGHKGIYRIYLPNSKWVDALVDNEDVSLVTDANNITDSMRVLSSEENKLYYYFGKLNKGYKVKTDLLQLLLAKYPKDDDFYKSAKEKMLLLQKEYLNFVNVTSQEKPKSFAARYIRTAQLPVIDINMPVDKQLAYLKLHGLDNVDFNDDDLINSDVFTNKAIEYLSVYRNPQMSKDLLERSFMVAVDTILNKAKVNVLVYQHVTEYLIDGFKKFGFDQIIDYIVDNYVIKDDLCLDEKLQNSIQRRMDQSKHLKIGTVVPHFVLPDSTGKDFDLGSLSAEKTLIIFYASWCPHCQELLPKISELYRKQPKGGMKVVAVSIDTSRADWTGFVKKNGLNWINVSDLKGWNGKAALDYYLYATPTMFVVNKKREIIAKPVNWEDVRKEME